MCCILKVDWHRERELAMSPGINLPSQQPVIESELLFSLSGLSHYQKRMLFLQHPFQQGYTLSGRDGTEHFESYRICSASCFWPIHSSFSENTKPKGGQGNNIAVPIFSSSTFLCLPLLQFTPMTASKMLSAFVTIAAMPCESPSPLNFNSSPLLLTYEKHDLPL